METSAEKRAIEKVVARLLEAVKEQEKKMGYIYWRHQEDKEKNA